MQELVKITELNFQLKLAEINLKISKLILPRYIDDKLVNDGDMATIYHHWESLGIIIEFKSDPTEKLYQLEEIPDNKQ